jgi:hypothetical protein
VRSVTGGNLVQISELFGRAIAAASRPDFLSRRLCPPLGEKRRRGEWLPLAPVARQGFVAGFRAFRAPLQRDSLAVWGQGRGGCYRAAFRRGSAKTQREISYSRQGEKFLRFF